MGVNGYRPDIDGLRAVAVVSVIIFHAGFSFMPGGFVGVDIFFVISGYLISKIIINDVRNKRFSILNFYERRLRRILPVLLLVLFCVVVVFSFISLPIQAISTSESAISALMSFSNIYFWSKSGYFSPASEYMPLLHTWSLGVEEQFYFIFPFIVIFSMRIFKKISYTLLILFGLFFLLGLWLSFNKSSVAYYLLPARSWELIAGSLVAADIFPKIKNKFITEFLSVVGFLFIFGGLFFIESTMAFPGWVALFPCLGAAIILWEGGKNFISKYILSSRLFVAVGLISYSLYLWHWPVLVAMKTVNASLHLSSTSAIWAIAFIFLISWCSWAFVERPFRSSSVVNGRSLVILLGSASLVVIGVSSTVVLQNGFPGRLSEKAWIILSGANDVDSLRDKCERRVDETACRFGYLDQPIKMAIVGDSHAAALRPAFEKSSLLNGGSGLLVWSGACPLLLGSDRIRQGLKECTSFKEGVIASLLKMPELETVVLAGRWAYQTTGWLPESGRSNRDFFVDDMTKNVSIEENENVFRRSMMRTLNILKNRGVRVVIIGAVPEPGFDVPLTLALSYLHNLDVPSGIPRSQVEDRMSAVDRIFNDIVVINKNVDYISIWEDLCDTVCRVDVDGYVMYSDNNHFTRLGASKLIAPIIENRLIK